MDAKLKDLWLKALRSGEYEQTSGTLFDGQAYCCLGVLCDVALSAGLVPAGFSVVKYDDRLDVVPSAMAEAIGTGGAIVDGAIERNDGMNRFAQKPQSFSQIADWLETALSEEPSP